MTPNKTTRRKAPAVDEFNGVSVNGGIVYASSWRLRENREDGGIEGPVMTDDGIVHAWTWYQHTPGTMLEFVHAGFVYRVHLSRAYSRIGLSRIARRFARHVVENAR